MIFPLNMLKARQEFIEMCNRKFGWSAEVHFAGAWLGEMERYETTIVQNGEIDIDNYDAVQEGEENESDESADGGEGTEPDNEPDSTNEGSGADQNGDEDDEQKGD